MNIVLGSNNQEKTVKVILSLNIDNNLYYLYEYNNKVLYLGRRKNNIMYHLNDSEYEVVSNIIKKMNIIGEFNE